MTTKTTTRVALALGAMLLTCVLAACSAGDDRNAGNGEAGPGDHEGHDHGDE